MTSCVYIAQDTTKIVKHQPELSHADPLVRSETQGSHLSIVYSLLRAAAEQGAAAAAAASAEVPACYSYSAVRQLATILPCNGTAHASESVQISRFCFGSASSFLTGAAGSRQQL